MKTTIDIADGILRQAKSLAARKNTTLKAIVEDALQVALDRERRAPRPAGIETRTFSGNGLQPGHSWDDWGAMRDLAYEGRGA